MNELLAAERGRRNLRIALAVIIVATLPFYCVGLLLLINAPARGVTPSTQPVSTQALQPTNTVPGFPSVTPLPQQSNPTLQATPGQFFPTVRFITATFTFPTVRPTDFVFPTMTVAPSLTPFPSSTPYPTLTDTPIPVPTLTDTPIPLPTFTDTPSETPTETPTLEILPP
jgi:hypothetical protein